MGKPDALFPTESAVAPGWAPRLQPRVERGGEAAKRLRIAGLSVAAMTEDEAQSRIFRQRSSTDSIMCNAAKHPPGCECGFGPPYSGGYSASEVREWPEELLDNPELARRGLSEMAWDNASIEAFIERYLAIRNSDLPRDTMVSRI